MAKYSERIIVILIFIAAILQVSVSRNGAQLDVNFQTKNLNSWCALMLERVKIQSSKFIHCIMKYKEEPAVPAFHTID